MGLREKNNETTLGHKIENLMIWKELGGVEKIGILEFEFDVKWEENALGLRVKPLIKIDNEIQKW